MKSSPSVDPDDAAFVYPGEELDLFAQAYNWKHYWARQIAPYLGSNVLEVGAGTGTNTSRLVSQATRRWVCLEPDAQLVERLRGVVAGLALPPGAVEVRQGDIQSLPGDTKFDTILYIDVLEHIEADQAELERAFNRLSVGGHLIVLSPAHPFLFTPFDAGIGHFRRYTRAMLRAAGPAGTPPVKLFYLDSVGFFASLANRLLLQQKLPTAQQIHFWDQWLVRASFVTDPLLGYNFGKTVVGIWERP